MCQCHCQSKKKIYVYWHKCSKCQKVELTPRMRTLLTSQIHSGWAVWRLCKWEVVPPTESTENHNYQKSRVELVDVSRRFDCISHQLDQTSYQRLHHLVSGLQFFRFKLKLQLPVFSPRLELTPADSTCTEIFNFLSIFSFKTWLVRLNSHWLILKRVKIYKTSFRLQDTLVQHSRV